MVGKGLHELECCYERINGVIERSVDCYERLGSCIERFNGCIEHISDIIERSTGFIERFYRNYCKGCVV